MTFRSRRRVGSASDSRRAHGGRSFLGGSRRTAVLAVCGAVAHLVMSPKFGTSGRHRYQMSAMIRRCLRGPGVMTRVPGGEPRRHAPTEEAGSQVKERGKVPVGPGQVRWSWPCT